MLPESDPFIRGAVYVNKTEMSITICRKNINPNDSIPPPLDIVKNDREKIYAQSYAPRSATGIQSMEGPIRSNGLESMSNSLHRT